MLFDETNPNPEDEANLDTDVEANLDTESRTTDGSEPNVATEPESPTPEQIEEWRRGYQANATTQAEFTRQQQALRDRERELDRIREANEALMGRERQRIDPLEQLDAQLEETYDPAQRRQLQRQRDQVIMQRATEMATRNALSAWHTQRALGDDDPNELVRFRDSLTESDHIEMLRLMRDKKAGKLYDRLTAEQQQKQERARRATAINTLIGGDANPGMRPGAGSAMQPKTIDDVTFMLSTKKRQKELLDAGYMVVNNMTGEEIPIR